MSSQSNKKASACRQPLVFIKTYGCQMNEADSERIAAMLKAGGYELVDKEERADLILLNTCCVRDTAEEKAYGKIGDLRRLKRKNPHLILGICGCIAQKEKDNLFKRFPWLNLVVGTGCLDEIPNLVEKARELKSPQVSDFHLQPSLMTGVINVAPTFSYQLPFQPSLMTGEIFVAPTFNYQLPPFRKSPLKAWVPIIRGCNRKCSFCIVPYVRGRERSRPEDEILSEIKELGKQGYKEVTLLGQNVVAYRLDEHQQDRVTGSDFAALLKRVNEIEGIERIRFVTSHPLWVKDELIETVSKLPKVCEYFHLPVQSGDDEILRKMKRGYTTDYYRSLISKVREKIPTASITTDIIVGFPGETNKQFEKTLNLMKDIEFDSAFTFLYSTRSGTEAADLPEQISKEVKKKRLEALNELQEEVSLRKNKRLVGTIEEVLVEEEGKAQPKQSTVHSPQSMVREEGKAQPKLVGRTRTNKIVIFAGERSLIGELVRVRITEAGSWTLRGVVG